MADDQDTTDEKEVSEKKSGLGTVAIIGIIAGALVVQALIVIVALMVLKDDGGEPASAKSDSQTEKPADEDDEDEDADHDDDEYSDIDEEDGIEYRRPVKHIVQLDDIIVNPRGAAASYVVVGIGLEIPSAEDEPLLEPIMVPIKQVINDHFAMHRVERLKSPEYRDTLRVELRKKLRPYFRETRLLKVYFSKFLIQ